MNIEQRITNLESRVPTVETSWPQERVLTFDEYASLAADDRDTDTFIRRCFGLDNYVLSRDEFEARTFETLGSQALWIRTTSKAQAALEGCP